MKPFEQETRVFIIRVWHEPREIAGAPPVWRGLVEYFPSGDRRFFQDLESLLKLLEGFLDRPYVDQRGRNGLLSRPTNVSDSAESVPPAPSAASGGAASLDNIRSALVRLDQRLAEAVLAAQSIYGIEAAQTPFRGLHVSAKEVRRLLQQEPATPRFATAAVPLPVTGQAAAKRPPRFFWLVDWVLRRPLTGQGTPVPTVVAPEPAPAAPIASEPEPAGGVGDGDLEEPPRLVTGLVPTSPLARLADMYNLSDFDLDVLLISLAPELDLRYERLYAFLQDNVSRRRPSVDLALNLLCNDADEKAARRVHFSPDAPLLRNGLLRLIPDHESEQPPLLAHFFRLDSQVVRFLIGESSLDPRLAPFAQLISPDTGSSRQTADEALVNLLANAWNNSRALRLYLQEPLGSNDRSPAEWLAAELGIPLLFVDLPGALAADRLFEWAPRVIMREGWLHDALVYLHGFDSLRSDERAIALDRLWSVVIDDEHIVLLEGTQPWVPPRPGDGGVITIALPLPGYAERRSQWEALLLSAGAALEQDELETLARRFCLSASQIQGAFATACNLASLREAGQPDGDPENAFPNLDDLFAAARGQTGHELAALAHKIEPLYRWTDIVLPQDTLDQIREICQRVVFNIRVLEEWGFENKISLGKGTTVLFSGPSGTGKTMAAEILAAELGLDLYKIDLSGVVSKYIGETEKNLERIFRAAENSNAILFFDEADALFGKRSEVRDSHDRYANIEISYLLQKMESYNGITILSTNLRQNLDESFVRRMSETVSFPFPDEASRRRIWEGIWPADLPHDFSSADLDDVATRFKLSGGNIKNVALAAAYLAASEDKPVGREHILRAIQREYQKLGKILTQEELTGIRKERVA